MNTGTTLKLNMSKPTGTPFTPLSKKRKIQAPNENLSRYLLENKNTELTENLDKYFNEKN